MCGRYSFVPTKQQLETELEGISLPAQLPIRFNIAPTQQVLVIANDRPHLLQPMIWGLVPSWSREAIPSGKMINARAEGISEKPSFRDPIRRRRCLVPADSFYEWRVAPGNKKVPYRILAQSGRLLMMAGIWDEWGSGRGSLRTMSIVTTTPNLEMSALHNRMPVLLDRSAAALWLSAADLNSVLAVLHPAPDGALRIYRVSDKLNQVGYDAPDLHDPVQEPPTLF